MTAPVTSATLNVQIQKLQSDFNIEAGKYPKFETQLTLPAEVNNNWRSINKDFSTKVLTLTSLMQQRDALNSQIAKLTLSEQTPLKTSLGTVDGAVKVIESAQSRIFTKLVATSASLGPKAYPLTIATTKDSHLARIALSDIEQKVRPDGSIEIVICAKQPTSLLSQIANGLYKHSGKLALAGSVLIIAGQTEAGAKLASELGTTAYESAKPMVVAAATKVVGFVSSYLPEIGTALSAYWSLPKVYAQAKEGHYKAAALTLATGIASGIAPHASKIQFPPQETIDKVSQSASFCFWWIGGVLSGAKAVWEGSKKNSPKVAPLPPSTTPNGPASAQPALPTPSDPSATANAQPAPSSAPGSQPAAGSSHKAAAVWSAACALCMGLAFMNRPVS